MPVGDRDFFIGGFKEDGYKKNIENIWWVARLVSWELGTVRMALGESHSGP